jgi:hypothetical protein
MAAFALVTFAMVDDGERFRSPRINRSAEADILWMKKGSDQAESEIAGLPAFQSFDPSEVVILTQAPPPCPR